MLSDRLPKEQDNLNRRVVACDLQTINKSIYNEFKDAKKCPENKETFNQKYRPLTRKFHPDKVNVHNLPGDYAKCITQELNNWRDHCNKTKKYQK